MKRIDSPQNSLVKTIRRLAQPRQRERNFLLEGRKLVDAALDGDTQIEMVVVSSTFRGRVPRSLRTSKHQLIYNADDESWEFYRLEEDPQGLRDRYGDASRVDPAALAELEAGLREQMVPRAGSRRLARGAARPVAPARWGAAAGSWCSGSSPSAPTPSSSR